MNILSLQLGHNATVLLMADGYIKSAISQEKFDNNKNSFAFPHEAIEWVLSQNKLTSDGIDHVAICGLGALPQQLDAFAIEEKRNNHEKSVLKKLYAKAELNYGFNSAFSVVSGIKKRLDKRRMIEGREQLLFLLKDRYGIGSSKVEFVEHHVCHTYSPAYFFGDEDREWIILTMDGAGDRYFCSVNTFKNGVISRISNTPWAHSLGYVYSMTTKFLGMKPLEHEYKVMGLAAYAKKGYFEGTYNRVFKGVAWLKKDGSIEFSSKFPLNRFEEYLRNVCIGERFDNVAGALQQFLEDLVLDWVRLAIKKIGIRNVMTSGGVFMNVKLNKLIQELPEVERVRFMPSCGDESNPFGAAYAVMERTGKAHSIPIPPLGHVYLGHEFSNDDIRIFIKSHDIERRYDVQYHENIEDVIAKMIADFNVVARVAGKAEFGARSLGNRAILANPSDMKSFYTVNDLIKARDFWMPFAPSILDTDVRRYLLNPKDVESPYMITAFDTTPLAHDHLRAAMHQGDKTVRPQIVTEKANLKYYRLIMKFKEHTNIGGILNTSYNLHGFPLASTLEQALFTFENSGLKNLALENYLLSKS